MSLILDLLKSIVFGIVEGITEWLPVSSTGHLILLEDFLKFENVREDFWSVFEVVIQLGAILAVVVIYFKKLWPFSRKGEVLGIIRRDKLMLWLKILVACIPAAVIGLLFDDLIDSMFYNPLTVGIMLIAVGIAFLIVEGRYRPERATVDSLEAISFGTALGIGLFQVIAAVLPGTSRSGATILGGLMLGISRTAAAEFTFFLAIPVMFGASLLKLIKFGVAFTAAEGFLLLIGMAVAFGVSMLCIRFLMDYIKRRSFKVFGWYRIVLGAVVLACFALKMIL